jgi:hypothetical protein
MKKILRLALHSLLGNEHYEFISEVIKLITRIGATALKIEAEFIALFKAFKKEDICMRVIRKSEYTARIKEADKLRDESYRSLVQYVKSFEHYHQSDMAEAAERISILLHTYGDVTKKTYDGETADIDNILFELRHRYSSDVTMLNCDDRVDQLDTVNTEFKNLVDHRYEEHTELPDYNLKEVRVEVDADYKAIVDRITALVQIEGEANYIAFIDQLNVYVKHYEWLIKEHQGTLKRNQKNLADADISEIGTQIYTGAHIVPFMTVFYKDKHTQETLQLSEDKDYIVEYTNNIEVGTATVTIKGKGAYAGKKITTFNIVHPE